jgi:hypothetical protein
MPEGILTEVPEMITLKLTNQEHRDVITALFTAASNTYNFYEEVPDSWHEGFAEQAARMNALAAHLVHGYKLMEATDQSN